MAGVGVGGGAGEACLHGGESAGVVGADGGIGGGGGVAVEAAGEIDGEHSGLLAVRVDPMDGGVEGWSRVALCAGAEQGVD